LNARNFFAKAKPVLRYNQFGYSIGGPIRRNKTFFFYAYQGLRSKNPAIAISSTPGNLVRQGNFTGFAPIYDPATTKVANGAATRTVFPGNLIPSDRIDPVAAKLLSFWPAPNQSGNANNYYSVGGQIFDRGIYNVKVDHNFSAAHRLTGTYELNYETFNYLNPFPGAGCYPGNGFCGPLIQRNHPATVTDTYTARSNLVNQFRFAFLRNATEADPPSLGKSIPEQVGLKVPPPDSFPFISVAGALPTTIGSGIEVNLYQTVFEPSDTLSWMKGRHNLKFGGAMQKVRSNISQGLDSGIFSFTGLFTGQPPGSGIGFADYLLGLPQVFQLNKPLHLGSRRWSFNSFVQDNFKVSSKLTLEFGLRYQREAMFHELHGRESNFDPTLTNPATGTLGAIVFPGDTALQKTHNLFAPRFGIAWAPLSRTTIRMAYGIFYIPPSGGTNANSTPAGFNLSETVQTTDQLTPQFQLVNGPPPVQYLTASQRTASILNGQSVAWYPQSAPFGYYQQWHFTIQRQFASDIVLEAAYVGTKGTHLLFPRDLNQVPPALLGPGNAQLRRPYPQYATITSYLMDANSSYQSVQFSLRKNFSHGLTFLTNYVISKSLDNSSSEMQTAGVTSGNEWQIASRPNLNRGISQFDLPQRLVVTAVYDLPFGAGRTMMNRSGVLNAFFGGWRTSTIFTAQSGIPFTVFAGGANLSGALTGNWYPNRLASGNPASGQSIFHWFDTTAFANAAAFTFGNSGRDILRGPGFWNDDFALSKEFHPIERLRINLRGDFANIFNHANFGQPNATLGSAATGTITSATSPRAIQVSLRVLF
jgi:hypothetical protein